LESIVLGYGHLREEISRDIVETREGEKQRMGWLMGV
jgi:hypothetical protein